VQKGDMISDQFHLIGIGTAEGGVEPLCQIFSLLPDEPNGAFFILNHTPPAFPSFTRQLLQLYTRMPVLEAMDEMPVQVGHLYVLPVNHYMTLKNGKIFLQMREPQPRSNRAIDNFMISLAADAGSRAVGILLSGSGNDGVAGLGHIARAGGITIVQDLESAEYPKTPRNAADAGVAIFILEPAGIAGLLNELIK
jgi:chemotaxis response regulator CheB